jgi:hypothetical protein
VVWGKKWDRNRASSVAFPAWSDGKAPNTKGEFENPVVYVEEWKRASIRANPPGEPFMP